MKILSIYQIQEKFFKKTFGKIISKIYNTSRNTQIVCQEKDIEKIDNILWTFDKLSFLPHHNFNDSMYINKNINSIVINKKHIQGYDSNIYMSYKYINSDSKKIYLIDAGFNKYNFLIKKLYKHSIKFFFQNYNGVWSQKHHKNIDFKIQYK